VSGWMAGAAPGVRGCPYPYRPLVRTQRKSTSVFPLFGERELLLPREVEALPLAGHVGDLPEPKAQAARRERGM